MASKDASKARDAYAKEYPGATPLHGSAETFKWDKPGVRLEGLFLGMHDGTLGGKMVRIQTGQGVETASAPIVLERALENVKQGQRVAIVFTGEEPSKKGQKVKTFEVYALR